MPYCGMGQKETRLVGDELYQQVVEEASKRPEWKEAESIKAQIGATRQQIASEIMPKTMDRAKFAAIDGELEENLRKINEKQNAVLFNVRTEVVKRLQTQGYEVSGLGVIPVAVVVIIVAVIAGVIATLSTVNQAGNRSLENARLEIAKELTARGLSPAEIEQILSQTKPKDAGLFPDLTKFGQYIAYAAVIGGSLYLLAKVLPAFINKTEKKTETNYLRG